MIRKSLFTILALVLSLGVWAQSITRSPSAHEPLMDFAWCQWEPFNMYCKVTPDGMGEQQCFPGCVATAMENQAYNGNPTAFISFAPAAGTGIKTAMEHNDKKATIYDLQGRRLTKAPAKGIYIQGGRKYVK